MDRILVTGGAGFIGSAFIRFLLKSNFFVGRIINLDLLTYAGNLANLNPFQKDSRYFFIRGNIKDQDLIEKIFNHHQIDTVIHFAAETHVDRSINSAYPFFDTNVMGTLALLEAVRKFPKIHFHHISTDEVYGSLREKGFFQESSPYRPNSPYAASKAASDHLIRSFSNTYGLSTTVSHCCNNYGIGQSSEKFIPKMILSFLENKPLEIYGSGTNVRDWLHVDDHVAAILIILQKGIPGQTYDIGSSTELTNLALVEMLLHLIAEENGVDPEKYRFLIRFVADRPGHDFRYAIDASKISKELGWRPKISLLDGLRQTIQWYMKGGSRFKQLSFTSGIPL